MRCECDDTREFVKMVVITLTWAVRTLIVHVFSRREETLKRGGFYLKISCTD
jgi:hypothetical protein